MTTSNLSVLANINPSKSFGAEAPEALDTFTLTNNEAREGEDIGRAADELWPMFIIQMVDRHVGKKPLTPRNAEEVEALAFFDRLSDTAEAELEDVLISELTGYIQHPVSDFDGNKVVEIICKQLVGTLVYWVLGRENQALRTEMALAKMKLLDVRGLGQTSRFFGNAVANERESLNLPILKECVERMQCILSSFYAIVNANGFELGFGSRKDPYTGQYVNFDTLQDAVDGIREAGDIEKALAAAARTESKLGVVTERVEAAYRREPAPFVAPVPRRAAPTPAAPAVNPAPAARKGLFGRIVDAIKG